MKKILNIFLILLSLAIIGCEGMLKDASEAGAGFGDIIVKQSNILIDSNLETTSGSGVTVTEGGIDFTTAEVKINGTSKGIGEKFEGLKSGEYKVTVEVKSIDKKDLYYGTEVVKLKVAEVLQPKITLDSWESAVNSWKITFNPTEAGVTVANEVHLVGTLNGWDPTDKTYSLVKQSDGTWSAIYDLDEGTEFKFIYDSTEWNGNDIGNNGANYKLGTNTDGVAEPVLAWKITFNPTEAGVTVANEVHLVGTLNGWDPTDKTYSLVKQSDGTWSAIYDLDEGTEFKFIYDSTEWNGNDIGNNGANYKLGTNTDGVATMDF
ncbi:hypothetical protein EV215_1591 [Hypnocyclicus thermotrophus]|uniref:CBM20 domain-containing protein n=1 Tax=Hypnocyclicus thermotrophus TaxID=1627895 RepID=A0AA46DXL9_9FUSO|nr:hypothetical protein [Hypnocyclicus thermotrophus]TDT68524.1 hypothetical protein EV215_1591 [Hypnocyclicus thermotrophus]